jgi:putative ABC transport system permease protein
MLRNYLLVAWRTLRKRVGPTLINVFGLAVGLAACLLIGLWVERELSYDTFHPDADRIRRVLVRAAAGGNSTFAPQGPAPLKGAIRRDIPEVATVTQFRTDDAAILHRENQSFTDTRVLRADSTFLDVFGGFRLLRGDRTSALDGTNALVLTAPTARRVFGSVDVIGETLRYRDETRQVTGVIAEVPETSHLQFDAVAPIASVPPTYRDNWTGFSFYTYAKLHEGASVAAFEEKLHTIAREYGAADIQESFNFPLDKITYEFPAEALPSIHLYSEFNSFGAGGSITTVYVFGAIGLFILLIACINFMNLATARAGERATEVGVRKALGAGRRQLGGQFLGEAVLTTAAATVLALVGAALFLPVFNDLAGTSMGVEAFLHPTVLLSGLRLVLLVGLVAGSYPALALSRFPPAATLKAGETHTSSGQDRRIRQGLVVLQFAISIVLLVGTLVAREQFDYIQNKRLGFDKERVVEVEGASDLGPSQETFVDRVRRLPGVAAASAGDGLFGGSDGTAFWPADSTETVAKVLRYFKVGPRFVETMDISLAEGRSFDPSRPSDSSAVILNQAAVAAYGLDDPTSARLEEGNATFDVIGVVENFHFQSMRQEVEPAALFLGDPRGSILPGSVYARLSPGGPSGPLDEIRSTWSAFAGATPFQYSFVDQTYDRLHRDVQQAGTLFSLFAGLAIVIACLGLFGLATYTVQRRRKEIGIRKALGATAAQVVGLLSKQFLTLVGVGAAIALPLAYWAMEQWLQGFAYRTTIGVGAMGGAVALAGGVALVTVGYHALRAARIDPTTTLKDG